MSFTRPRRIFTSWGCRVPVVCMLCPGPGHKFEPRLRSRGHQCLWIRLMAASMWVKVAWLPCRIHAYTVYTSIGGKGRCRTRCDLQDHCMQARKSAGERSTPDLKPSRNDTRSPKQEQSVAPQTGPWSNKILKKKSGSYCCLSTSSLPSCCIQNFQFCPLHCRQQI